MLLLSTKIHCTYPVQLTTRHKIYVQWLFGPEESLRRRHPAAVFCQWLILQDALCRPLSKACPSKTQAQTGWQPRVKVVLLPGTIISRDLKEVCSNFLLVISTWASVTLWGSSESQWHKIASCHCLKNPCNQHPFPRLHSGERLW